MSISPINAQSTQLRAIAALRKNAATTPGASSAPAAPRQADSVELSDAARALTSASQAVSDAPDVREDRVAALKAQIACGNYSVDSSTLARAMVRSKLS
jgi:negative regulator of flagellin synthesis FlgM